MRWRRIDLAESKEVQEGDEVYIVRYGCPKKARVVKRTKTRALVEFEGRVRRMQRWVHSVYLKEGSA